MTDETGNNEAIAQAEQAWPLGEPSRPMPGPIEPTLTDIQKSAVAAAEKIEAIAQKLVGLPLPSPAEAPPEHHVGFMARVLADMHDMVDRIKKAL